MALTTARRFYFFWLAHSDLPTIEDELNRLGAQGYELTAVSKKPTSADGQEVDCFMRRPVE